MSFLTKEYYDDKLEIIKILRDIELAVGREPRDLIDAKNIIYFVKGETEKIREVFENRELWKKEVEKEFEISWLKEEYARRYGNGS